LRAQFTGSFSDSARNSITIHEVDGAALEYVLGLHWRSLPSAAPKHQRTEPSAAQGAVAAANHTMSATTSIEVQPDAYCLMFLHACKYPARAVNGLLLGTAAGDSLKVQKALPLFHSSFALSPMLETALMLVRSAL